MKPVVTIIVAVARDGAIGRRGDLLFHISDDLRRFKRLTMGHPIVMGRKTFESFPKGPLPGRTNIVVTRSRDYDGRGATVAGSLDEALKIAAAEETGRIFIIGGGEIYRQAFGIADALELTDIDAAVDDADTFFPAVKDVDWELTEESEPMTDPKTGISYSFITYARRR